MIKGDTRSLDYRSYKIGLRRSYRVQRVCIVDRVYRARVYSFQGCVGLGLRFHSSLGEY